MTTLHKVQVLRIKKCSDFMMWYRDMPGQLVPHLGWSPLHGYKSRDANGNTNFVLSDDAYPATVHVSPSQLLQWPFNCTAVSNKPHEGSQHEPPVQKTGQTHMQSMTETIVNIGTGFLLSLAVTHYVLPWYGHHVTHSENLQITAIFTLVSIVRSYFFRRVFNHVQVKA